MDESRRPPEGFARCPVCEAVVENVPVAWQSHERGIRHMEAKDSRAAEVAARHSKPEPRRPFPANTRSPFGALKDEILDAAKELREDRMSHTDVASWLLQLAERLERR